MYSISATGILIETYIYIYTQVTSCFFQSFKKILIFSAVLHKLLGLDWFTLLIHPNQMSPSHDVTRPNKTKRGSGTGQ